jgi:predicted PurR-regulated permease PerM
MIEKKESYSELTASKKLLYLFYIVLSVVFILIIYIYRYFFWPFLFSLVLYVVLKSFYNCLIKYLKIKWICSSLIIISIIILLLIPLFLILITLTDQAYEFYIYLQQQYKSGVFHTFLKESAFLKKLISFTGITETEILQQIVGTLSSTSLKIFSNLTGILSFSLKLIANIFFMLLILFFLFKDGDKLAEKFYKNMPFPDDIEKDIVSRLNIVIKVLLAGNLFIMILQGLVLGIGFAFFGVPMPLLWACITAVFSLIPVIGTTLIWLPAVIFLFTKGSFISAIILGLWCLIGYLVLENLVKPRIFGKKLNFHPLIFFFLLIGSIQAFNLPGIIIGPVLLTLFFSLWELYRILDEYRLKSEL